MEIIELLLKVQGIDQVMSELTTEHGAIPAQLEELDQNSRKLKNDVEERGEELKGIKLSIREAESKTVLLDETEQKYKQQLMTVKTNREYSALLTEIESVKRQKEELDENAIKSMERIEAVQTEIQGIKSELKEFQNQSKDKREELQGRLNELQEKMAVEKQKRENLAIRIDKSAIKLYERIMKSRKNLAVVALRNGSCGGCFAEVPLQRVADIRKGDQLLTCDYCGRILYFEE
ncbi:zinc ribbon domain-containing protein [Gemmatimonadota bacterium]